MSGIVRVEKNGNYTVLHRAALNDKRLSWKAKGIIAYMLSMPNDWVFYMDELMTHSTEREKAFRSGFNELKEHGYVKRFPVYENKKIVRWETVVFESPQIHEENLLSQNVQVGKVDVGLVDVQKEALLSTELELSTDPVLSTEKKNNVELALDDTLAIIEYLNVKASKSFKATTSATKKFINGRLAEGHTVEDFKRVIDIKVSQWLNNPDMNSYLRPSTLFSPTNFENYLNENTSPRTQTTPRTTPRPVELDFTEGEDI